VNTMPPPGFQMTRKEKPQRRGRGEMAEIAVEPLVFSAIPQPEFVFFAWFLP
jgi:hypothetical protein